MVAEAGRAVSAQKDGDGRYGRNMGYDCSSGNPYSTLGEKSVH